MTRMAPRCSTTYWMAAFDGSWTKPIGRFRPPTNGTALSCAAAIAGSSARATVRVAMREGEGPILLCGDRAGIVHHVPGTLTGAGPRPYSAWALSPSSSRDLPDGRRSPALLVCGLTLVLAAFAVTRVPFLLDWRLPLVFPDTATYLWPLGQMEGGRWPLFDLRTPG